MNAVTGVEGGDRELERQAGSAQRDPDQDQLVVRHVAAEAVPDAGKVRRPRPAVDEREPVEQGGRAEGANDQVLEAGLERFPAAQRRPAEHVQRDREQLEPDEEDDQVLGHRKQRHAEHRGDQ
jgi:hypothetical protein